jgi:hypothetical protein
MKSKAKRGYIQVIIVVAAIVFFVGFVLIPKAVAEGRVHAVLFYRVRFEVLGQTPKGLYYTHLFDVHVEQIANIFMSHSSLKVDFIDSLVRWQPNLKALVNGRGDEVVISEDDVASITNYLNRLAQHASPGLQSVIEEELAATPLEGTIGMTINQAWAYLNEDPRFQAQVLVPQEFPYLKADSTNIIAGAFSETSKYEISFGEETWALSAWNNGVAASWVAENQDLSDCVLTTPRSVLEPYWTLEVSYKTLGDTRYEVRTADTKIKELGILYILYQPIDIAGQPFQENHPPFILYPGLSNAAQCIEQSEGVLASLYLVPNDE